MLGLAIALAGADVAFGAPFPEATMIDGPRISATTDAQSGHRACYLDYKLRSTIGLAAIAKYYLDQGREEQARLIGDTRDKFADYRTIAFAAPNFMFVILSRERKATIAKVTVKMPDGCRAPG